MRVLVVCTGNICRSPMGEAFLRAAAHRRGIELDVSSAGNWREGLQAEPFAVKAALDRGADIRAHLSRKATAEMLHEADLVLAMERSHFREIAVLAPDVLQRSFTFKEFVRRAREHSEPIERVSDLARGRAMSEVLGTSPVDETADPYKQSQREFDKAAQELYEASESVVDVLEKLP